MNRNAVETLLGAFVIIVAIVFVIFFQRTTDIKPTKGYELTAKFTQIDGIDRGTPVRISGVKVGQVTGFELDTDNYLAIVSMSIEKNIELPYDTSAVISSESLLGGKYMSLQPGGDTEMLQPGDSIEFTQSTPGIEALLGQAIYNMSGNGNSGSKNSGKAETTSPPKESSAPANNTPVSGMLGDSETSTSTQENEQE